MSTTFGAQRHNSTPFQNDHEFELNHGTTIDTTIDTTIEPLVQPKAHQISVKERMIAACSGSLITSLTMTPLDVVRIRLQQQEILNPIANCCKRQVFWDSASSSCQTEKSICIDEQKLKGTFRSMVGIAQKEGIHTLWRGLSLTLLMAGPANIVYFSGYDFLRDSLPLKGYGSLSPLVCGSLARVLAATTISPIELMKTRLQSIPSTQQDIFRSLMRTVYGELQLKGPIVLFRGLSLTLWRDVPFSGIYWASYEFLKKHSQQNWKVGWLNDEYNLFLHSFLSGSISGSIAALATNPFDVGKTRMQISTDTSAIGGTSLNSKEKHIFTFIKDIVKFEGVGALYVGLLPRLLKIAPSCAIMISSYEIGKRFFSKNKNKNDSCT